jgi:glycosyltransferase involved in cell wall biosynthesis
MIPFDQKVLDRLPVGLQRIRNWLLQRVMLNSMSLADCTIFISEYARELIQSKINVKRFATIYHGVSIDFRIGGRIYARPSLLPDGKYLLYVSRFDVYKHHFEVISAYSRLPLYLRQEYKLVLVGECDMPEAERALALIHQLELKDQVHVLGAIPYAVLPAFYAQAYAVLFASSCENCPNILLESLASGRPVMCSNVMPMPEFAGSSVSYFSPFDIDDIYKSMLRILEDKLYADTLAELSLKMSNMYNWEETAEATWKLILELHRT